ncbi:hypothetical protein GCK72_016051 [Caenorhabditis remanei]|uniref:Tyrosine-protein phosphatase domain-containing protein n=1 Tax=Caenorhabditis remanei TaxID=31234 RepID=A0A6A5GYB5_CAERE|nr:hypothetical protein GCK72_016051 [Caenorhabditis remanei]KAF1759584.1 hypothetical protein GCK72_016051 [Caenorhabditis remanei]
MKVFAFLSVATATAIYATTSHRRYYASDNHRDYPNFFADPRTSSGSRSANSHSSSDSSPDSPPPGSPSDSSQRSIRSASFPEHSDDFTNSHIRTIRNANDALNDYLEHATIIAHLVNGIALQSGLMNGSIPVNDVIGELLHLGSVDVPSIVNIKADQVGLLTQNVKKLPSELASDPEITDLESLSIEWDKQIAESKSVGDLQGFLKNQSYFDEAEKLKDNFDFVVWTQFVYDVNSLEQHLTAIEDIENPKTPPKGIIDNFQKLKKFEDIPKSFVALKDTMKTLLSYNLLLKGPDVFKPLEKIINLMRTRKVTLIVSNENIKKVKDNIEKILEVSRQFGASREDFSKILKLAESRSNPTSSNKKYGAGFPNGVSGVKQLEQDVRELWIGEILKIEVTKLNEFADSLKPLFNVNDRLIELDNQLKSLSSSESKVALSKFNDLQMEITVLTKESSEASDVLKEYPDCVASSPPAHPNSYKTASELLTHVKSLKDSLMAIVSAVDTFGLEGLQKETKAFVESVGFTDTTSPGKEFKELAKKVKASKSLQPLKNRVSDFKKSYDTITGQGITEKLEAIAKGQNDLKHVAFTHSVQTELKVNNCIDKHSKKSTLVAQAVQLIQKLRQLDSTKIEDVESVFSVISAVSKELSTASTIPDTMKVDSKGMTDDTNKLPDSLAKSEVIGRSVNSLRSAFALGDLETEVGKLKTIDSAVQAVIKKSSDPKTIQQQWGDHKEDMAELDKTLGQIESFEKNLNVSNLTTIGAYGTPLTALASLTSVNMNAKEKSKALDALLNDGALKIDPTVKENIEESKKTLDKLADLDLGFASHTTQFQSAPSVFNDLQNFLTKLLQVPMSPRQPSGQVPGAQGGPGGAAAIQQGQKSKEENGITTLLLIVIIAVALLAVVAMVGGGFCGFKKYTEHIWRSMLAEWEKKHCFKDLANVKDVHSGYMQVMDANVELWRKKGTLGEEKKRLLTQSCNPDSALFVQNENKEVMVFANKVTTLGGLDFIATHAPKDPQEFWQMVLSQNPEFVVSLCGDKEMKTLNCDYYPKKVAKPKKFGDYTVALTSEETAPKDVNKRSLTVTCGEKSLQLTHLQAVNWPAGDVPDDHETAFELMKSVNNSKSPVIVHCSDGNSATMSFIGLQFIFEEVRKHPIFNFGHFMHEMCERTWHPIEKYTFSAWTVLGVRKHLYDECKLAEEHKVDYDNDLKLLKDLKKEWIREDEARKEAIEATKEAERVRLANEKQKQDEEDDRRKKDQDKIDNLNKEVDELKKDKEAQQKYLETIQAKNNKIDEKNNEIEKKNKRLIKELEENLAKLTKEEADRKRELIEWVTKNYNEDVDSHYDFHDVCVLKYMKLLKVDVDRAAANLPSGKQAFDKYCNPDTAVEVMQDGVKIPIHANYVSSKIPNCTIFIATQAPTKQGYNGYCDDTTGDFWAMIFHHDSDFIVNLCQQSEMATLAQYFHSEPNKSVTCVRYNVRTESADLVFKEEVMKRVLTVTDMESKKVKTVIHFQLLNWIDKRIPKSHYAAMEVMNVVKKSKKHVVVHCKAGVGRTMSFIGLQFVYEEISNNPQFSTVMEPMRKMREMRWEAVQSVEQSFWIYLGVVLRLVRELGLDMSYYDKQFALLPAYRRKYIDDMKAKKKKEKEEKEKANKKTKTEEK